MKKVTMWRFLLLFLVAVNSSLAWDDHAKLTHAVLNDWIKQDSSIANYLNQSIKVESLTSFLSSTKRSLPAKMREIEQWAEMHERAYQPLPKYLMYQPYNLACSKNLETCFK